MNGPLGKQGSTGGKGLKLSPGRWPTYLDASGRAITTAAGDTLLRRGAGVYRHRIRVVNETHVKHEYVWQPPAGTRPDATESATELVSRARQEPTCPSQPESPRPESDTGASRTGSPKPSTERSGPDSALSLRPDELEVDLRYPVLPDWMR